MKQITDLAGKCYMTCAACMSVYADALSYANANPDKITTNIDEADNIIVLSCQVTDLAILNDFRTAERYRDSYPTKKIFISGCLAQRLDIELPNGVDRLEQMRCNNQHINDMSLVNFESPFWVYNFEPSSEFHDGNLFRNRYPLRIGKGCSFNCDFCTIKKTRGKHEMYDIDDNKIAEFLKFDDVLLIADSPTVKQIKDWCKLAIEKKKPISIRNIEPQVVVKCKRELIEAAKAHVLDVFHSPIQSNDPDVLKDMNRNVEATLESIEIAQTLKMLGVKIATNIIVDYKHFDNDFDEIYKLYHYVSTNPLWDGVWDRAKAEKRYRKYIESADDYGVNEDKIFILKQENLYYNSKLLNFKWYRKLYGGKWILIKSKNRLFSMWTKVPLSHWCGDNLICDEETHPYTGVDSKWKLFKQFVSFKWI